MHTYTCACERACLTSHRTAHMPRPHSRSRQNVDELVDGLKSELASAEAAREQAIASSYTEQLNTKDAKDAGRKAPDAPAACCHPHPSTPS